MSGGRLHRSLGCKAGVCQGGRLAHPLHHAELTCGRDPAKAAQWMSPIPRWQS